MNSIKWVFSWAGKQRWRFFGSVFLIACGIGLMIVEPFIFRSIIDDVLLGGRYSELIPLLAASLGFALVFLSVKYTNAIFCESMSQEIVYNLRNELFSRIIRQTGSFFRKHAAGDLITKCTGDVDMLRHFIGWVVPNAIESVLLILVVLIIFIMISPIYALCLFILTPITAFLGLRLGKKIRPAHNAVRESRAKLSTVVNENISGNRVVKAFTREDFETEKFSEQNIGFRDAQLNANKIWLTYSPLIESVSQVLGVVNLVVGGILVIMDVVTIGQMQIFISLAWALNQPMIQIGPVINDAQRAFASAEKLQELHYSQNDVKDPEKPAVTGKVRGDITFKNVSLKLGGMQILDDITLEIKSGQTIGIMGPTGSGKTMLASLIPRFTDVTEGAVLVDNINVEHYELSKLRGAIGMTMQDVFLFSASVENNIAYGAPEAEMEKITEAAKIADTDSFVSRMPDKYSTIIGERGTGLSGGQKQRISLARAILPEPSILILDDTTSAVDMETEKYIQSRLRGLPSKATTIIIAQRVSSISHADRIIILEDGKISESGTHDELMANKGYYFETCTLQQGLIESGVERGVQNG